MDIAEIALAAAMPVAMVLSIIASRYRRRPRTPSPIVGVGWDGSEHDCRFDTMVADKVGWRCGICGQPKKEVKGGE